MNLFTMWKWLRSGQLQAEVVERAAEADKAEERLRRTRRETVMYRMAARKLERYTDINHFAELVRREGFGGK